MYKPLKIHGRKVKTIAFGRVVNYIRLERIRYVKKWNVILFDVANTIIRSIASPSTTGAYDDL